MGDDGERYGPLSVRQWLRGYAVLKGWYISDELTPFHLSPCKLTRADLLGSLELAGLQQRESSAFIEAATLSQGKRDLFDAPLLQDEDGDLHLLLSILHSSALWKIVASQIGPFSKSSKKGSLFESSVIQLFRDYGIPAHSVTYKEDQIEYECDVLALWNGHLLVIECKNHLLPGSSPEHAFNFWQMLNDDVVQCKRIADQIAARPDLISKAFGTNSSVKQVHPILLNAMPFCIPGRINDVFVYDYSALNRFFTNPYLSFQVPVLLKDGAKLLTEHRVEALWGSDRPSPEDLIKEMNNPVQFAGHRGSWFTHRDSCSVSDSLAVEIPSLRSKDITLVDVLRDRGLDQGTVDFIQELAESLLNALEAE